MNNAQLTLPPFVPAPPVSDTVEITPEAERELVQRAQAGNEDAFGTLMRSHYEPVFRFVNSMLRDEHSARDVCQEIWLTVWKNLGSFRGDAKFSTWVHPIATRRAIDHLRARKRWFNRFIPFLSDTSSSTDSDSGGDRVTAAPEAVAVQRSASGSRASGATTSALNVRSRRSRRSIAPCSRFAKSKVFLTTKSPTISALREAPSCRAFSTRAACSCRN